MGLSSQLLASGTGWRVSDVVCTAGPKDRAFEERHASMCIALVMSGAFNYRSTHGSAVLVPGSLLLGNAGACFECGHEHSVGDRCLAFHIAPEVFESVAAAVPGNRGSRFTAPRLPLVAELLPLVATAECLFASVAGDAQDRTTVAGADRRRADSAAEGDEFHELALRLAGAVCRELSDDPRTQRAPSDRDRKRVAAALRRIESEVGSRTAPGEFAGGAGEGMSACESGVRLSLGQLAADAAMSPFHFLRVFEQVVGVTPAQYILRTRLRRAAVELRCSTQSISTIAADCGFRDLSTFNRQFKRVLGVNPGTYRITASGSRSKPR